MAKRVFRKILRDGRTEFLNGEKVNDGTTHPAYRNSARSIAQLYDALFLADITFGTISDELERAQEVFQEALTAWNMDEGTRDVIKFEEVDLLSILMHTGSTPAVLQKAEKMLGPLLMKDDPKMNELLKTLYVFLQCGGILECSMKELNISMSSLRYRIKRHEEQLSCQIRNPKSAFQLYASFETLFKAKMISIG